MCTSNKSCGIANGFNPDAGAKFQPGDLVRIGNAKQVYSVVKCHADYAEVDAGEGSTYRIPIGYLNKLSESSSVGVLLAGFTIPTGTIKKTYPSWGEGLTTEYLTGEGNLTTIGKPVIGLIPRKFHEENRITALMEAITRYLSDGRMIPEEWHDELNDLLYNRVERKQEA
jgi:hypothetical protein